jgi:hypothetical protein
VLAFAQPVDRHDLPVGKFKRIVMCIWCVFQEDNDGRFTNSDVSAYLCSGSDPSLREMSLILNDDAMLRGWQHLEQVLETGNPAFAAVNGKTFFEHIASDPKRSETMARFMKGIYGPEGPRIAAGFPFGRFKPPPNRTPAAPMWVKCRT